jgi:hypothetical protein
MSAQECSDEWRALWAADKDLERLPESLAAAEEGAFDCSSLISHERQLVEREINKSILRWKALDDRKLKNKAVGWAAVKLRLPLEFDYLSKLSSPPPDTLKGERVVSLTNPGETESYETELWKIFNDTRTVGELRMSCGLQKTMDIKDRLGETDASRLRMHDRHGLPAGNGPIVTTIFLELWRRSLKGSSVDDNQMILEFLAEQTLFDVHRAIQELTVDGLWTGGKSGLFLIEDTFYTTGDVDYVSSIKDWLNGDSSRKEYLGLSDELGTKSMESSILGSLQWSLNTRYIHIHHGHVESSLFLTDICQSRRHPLSYPILHDLWSPTYPAVLCEGCQQRAAILVTPSTCPETDGMAQICNSCHEELFRGRQSNAMDIHIFKQQQDLIPLGGAGDSFS